MCRIDLCGQIGVKISSYGDTQFIKINPLNQPWGRFLHESLFRTSVATERREEALTGKYGTILCSNKFLISCRKQRFLHELIQIFH